MSTNSSGSGSKVRQFEEFESRIVMSAQAVASLIPDASIQADASANDGVATSAQNQAFVATQSLQNSSQLSPTTAAAQLAQQYGLDGTGQTVAVIDTGIAFDHIALGGGFGAGNRVVGGYDFAENDDNPYDDGPTGFHGTHVAGIIGSSDLRYQGVAPGADLVALRVFDDAGANKLEWVEQALQWVHDNQHSFENPITTVNLSLGTTPDESYQAILNDELAQLKEDGIFISVAAGNHFDSQFSSNLAYPASSPSVVPVASHTSTGELSDFSQRASHVLTAPGQSITSTVPAHLFFHAKANPFVGSSGTSMAAPYVAGASAILRQANEMVGTESIDQDLLYQQLYSTADQVFDSVTGNYYAQVNLEAAIESVFAGRTNGTPTTVSTESPQLPAETEGGENSLLNQSPSFATVTDGVLTIKGTAADDAIALQVQGAESTTLNVVLNGRSQQFALATINEISVEGNGGEDVLSVKLGDGISVGASDDVVTLRHRQVNVLNEFFRLSAVDISEANVDNGGGVDALVVHGGSGSDRLNVSVDRVTVENANFEATTGKYIQIYAHGQQGDDSVALVGSRGNDLFAEYENTSFLRTAEQRVFAEGFENVTVDGNGGHDQANLGGTDAAETFTVNQREATVEQQGRQVDVHGFARINVTDADARDTVALEGSSGDDVFYGRHGSATFVGERFLHYVSHFENLSVTSGGGSDKAFLAGSAGDDQFQFAEQKSIIKSDGSITTVNGFDLTVARSGGGGYDTATFVGDDRGQTFYAGNGFIQSSGDGQATGRTIGFDFADIDGRGGSDVVDLIGGAGDDLLKINPNDVEFESTLQMLRLVNVERSNFRGGAGVDTVEINDIENLDLIAALGEGAQAVLRKHSAWFDDIEQLEADAVDNALAAYDLEKADFQFDLDGNRFDANKFGFKR